MKPPTILTEKGELQYANEKIWLLELDKKINEAWIRDLLLKLDKGNKCFSVLQKGLTKDGKNISSGILGKRLSQFKKDGWVIKVDSYSSSDQKDFQLTAKGRMVIAYILAGFALMNAIR